MPADNQHSTTEHDESNVQSENTTSMERTSHDGSSPITDEDADRPNMERPTSRNDPDGEGPFQTDILPFAGEDYFDLGEAVLPQETL